MCNNLALVGYIDDGKTYYDYKDNLEKAINLLWANNCKTIEDIHKWILENRIECLIVDHKLTSQYNFLGTEVISYINKHIPDLPCIILTSYKTDSMNENLVIDLLIKEREDLLKEDGFVIFGQQLKRACEVFKTRLKKRIREYEALYSKKKNGAITAIEEEELKQVYVVLRSYGEIDEIPSELLTSEMSNKVDILLEKLDIYIANQEKDNE